MNKVMIIGNLVRDPEMRTTVNGADVCSFTVAVNRRKKSQGNNQPEADFFRVSAWNELGRACKNYLGKGRKVFVCGAISVSTYTTQDGRSAASLDVMAQDVEFLTPRNVDDAGAGQGSGATSSQNDNGYQPVDEDLPWEN